MNNTMPFFNPNQYTEGFMNWGINTDNIKGIENRINSLEKEVAMLKNRFNQYENNHKHYNDNYSNNYQPNSYNMM